MYNFIRLKKKTLKNIGKITKTIRHGIGVSVLKFINDIILGIWPFLAATKKSRDEAKIPPLTAPKVEQATKTGIIHDITPRNRSPKVCN